MVVSFSTIDLGTIHISTPCGELRSVLLESLYNCLRNLSIFLELKAMVNTTSGVSEIGMSHVYDD